MIDAAILSVTRAEVEAMVEKHLYGAKDLSALQVRITRAVVVIVVLTNIVNVLGPIVVGYFAVQLYGSAIIGIITAVLTFGTIVFSEIIPKSLGSHYAPKISRFVAPSIRALILLLFPFVITLEWLTGMFKSGERKVGTEEQIRSLVTIGRREGHIESDEGQLIHRAFILNDKRAADIMTPLKDVVGVSADLSVEEAAVKIFSHAHSRYPVFGSSIHEVKGIIMKQDILKCLASHRHDEPVERIKREALTVDASMRSDGLLALFRDRNIHLAVVQDNEKTVGLVTLEDVLEELVGEIEDETDIED